MSTEEQKETLADKAQAQIDALKTKEGRAALKDKAKEGVEGAKKLWDAASIVQRVVVLVAVVLVTIFLTRSCGSNPPVAVVANTTQQGNSQQDEKAAPKFDGSVNLTKADDKTDSLKTFVGFTFGDKADKFKDIIESKWTNIVGQAYSGTKSVQHVKYEAIVDLKSKFRLFDHAFLQFTEKDKRLYKILLQTKADDVLGCKLTSILKETQFCAAMIERKYGERFNLDNTSRLYSKKTKKQKRNEFDDYDRIQDGKNGVTECPWESDHIARTLGTHIYADYLFDSVFAIAPAASYHGFFNNTIEIECTCGIIGRDDEAYLGITISAMDHSIIEEDGGRTKTIPLDADDDEGNL